MEDKQLYEVHLEIQFAVKRLTKRVWANSEDDAKSRAEKILNHEIEEDCALGGRRNLDTKPVALRAYSAIEVE